IATTDKGERWKHVGKLKDAQYGPIFGRDAKHLFVLTKAGVVESTDGGASWSQPVAPPRAMKGSAGLSWLEYDPKHDMLYLMKMGSDLYRLRRDTQSHSSPVGRASQILTNPSPVEASRKPLGLKAKF